jgi:hypothetical protein
MGSQPDQNISWEAPPPSATPRKPSKWQPIADTLKANPGKWAKVVTNGNVSVKSDAENGKLKCFQPAGSFEGRVAAFTGRFTGNVYLRYIGENGEYR